MKVVILAGGLGTRLSEETQLKPKPMVEIGGRPILWHIMKYFTSFGFNEFIICLGYKGYVIKEYFANYFLHMSDVTIDTSKNEIEFKRKNAESWKIHLVDTGESTLTGGRLKKIGSYLNSSEPFFFTYGDGLCDIDLSKLASFHKNHGKIATVTAVRPPGRYGALEINETSVAGFVEKIPGDGGYVNGGFFVLSPKALDFISGDSTAWEGEPLNQLVDSGELQAYRHEGFWQAMDTLRDCRLLEDMWNSGLAKWKNW